MPKHSPLPSREWLLENLRYEPESGLFWWVKPGPNRKPNRPIGHKSRRPERGDEASGVQVAFGTPRKRYLLHRVAWLIMTGNDPGDMTIDHINRDPFDNRWENLRLADSSLQMRNRRNFGKSKYKGVHYRSDNQKWRACVRIDGKLISLGQFDTEKEAAAAAAPYFIP